MLREEQLTTGLEDVHNEELMMRALAALLALSGAELSNPLVIELQKRSTHRYSPLAR